jgi:hypothetical protein
MLRDGAQLLIDCRLYHDVGLGPALVGHALACPDHDVGLEPALPSQPGVDVEGRALATDEHG